MLEYFTFIAIFHKQSVRFVIAYIEEEAIIIITNYKYYLVCLDDAGGRFLSCSHVIFLIESTFKFLWG